MPPKWLLRDTLDTPWALWGPCWELRGLLGRSVELLGGSLGALGRSLGALRGDFGSILGVFLMVSGAFLDLKRDQLWSAVFLVLRQLFVVFLYLAENAEIAPTRKNPMYLQLFRVILEALVSLFLLLFSFVFGTSSVCVSILSVISHLLYQRKQKLNQVKFGWVIQLKE